MLDKLNRQALEPHLNTTFIVREESGSPHELKLTAIEENTKSPAVEQLSLIFTGDSGRFLPQGNFEFEHPQIGKTTLFVVPVVGTDPSMHRYQVVLSRVREKKA